MTDKELTIWVRRQWNDWRDARYRITDLEGFHWTDISGGVEVVSPFQAFIHAYVWCDAMLEGELAHSCRHGEDPHRIKVCIVKKNNDPEVYKLVEEAANSGKRNIET